MSASIHETDLFILGVAVIGIALVMALFCIYDFDIERLLFEEEEMKKAQSLNELSIGQKLSSARLKTNSFPISSQQTILLIP